MRLTLVLSAILALTSPAIGQTAKSDNPPGQQGPAVVKDNYGNRQGYVMPNGEVRDNYGNRLGYIEPNGTLKDNYGNRLGQVKK